MDIGGGRARVNGITVSPDATRGIMHGSYITGMENKRCAANDAFTLRR